jgi:hypothetical protein
MKATKIKQTKSADRLMGKAFCKKDRCKLRTPWMIVSLNEDGRDCYPGHLPKLHSLNVIAEKPAVVAALTYHRLQVGPRSEAVAAAPD